MRRWHEQLLGIALTAESGPECLAVVAAELRVHQQPPFPPLAKLLPDSRDDERLVPVTLVRIER